MNIFGRESLKAPFKLPANIVSKAGLRHAGGIKRMLPVMLCLAAAGMALPVKAVQAVGHDTADHLGGNFLPVEQKGQRVRQGRGTAVELGFLIGKRDFHGRAPHFSE